MFTKNIDYNPWNEKIIENKIRKMQIITIISIARIQIMIILRKVIKNI